MGFRVLLIGIKGKSPEAIHRDFNVSPSGVFDEIPDAPVSGVSLPGGSYLLYIDESDEIIPEDRVFVRLSKNAELISCYANETVMDSLATGWKNGVKLWSVYHNGINGINLKLDIEGTLPANFEEIRRCAVTKQEADDSVDFMFNVPIDLFIALGGIRYDSDPPIDSEKPWQQLIRTNIESNPYGTTIFR